MSNAEISFWLCVPVYLVGALTISNWLADKINLRYRIYQENKLRKLIQNIIKEWRK